ncbi:hypothetical protein PIB30_038161 [Stylosanthes scabra]|uniref:Uncharacterized protein n=1 Tax=Stylosanthes scabra TaxID=79078 RepID=A0ABU6XFS2_9FABA|nr:hypothetical protein [Stylosanthes scabra]
MPIYHDYHGDSKSSSISTWDQIQISLKFLLPSYEPILCVSPLVSSLLSDPICTDFKQIVTLHEIQDEEYSDVEIQENSAIPDAEIPEISLNLETAISIHTQQQAEISTPEMQASTMDSTNQNSKIHPAPPTIIDNIHQQNSEIQCQNQIQIQKLHNQAKSDFNFQKINNYSTNQEEEWNSASSDHRSITNLDSKTKIAVKTMYSPSLTDQKQEEDAVLNEMHICYEFDDQSTTVAVNQPPPKPPDPSLHSSTEDDASVRGKCTSSSVAARTTTATVADGGLWARQLRRFVSLTSSPLLAAVFPWNRGDDGEEQSHDGWQWSTASNKIATTAEGSAEVGASAQAKQGATKLRASGCVGFVDGRATWMNGETPFHSWRRFSLGTAKMSREQPSVKLTKCKG